MVFASQPAHASYLKGGCLLLHPLNTDGLGQGLAEAPGSIFPYSSLSLIGNGVLGLGMSAFLLGSIFFITVLGC